MGTIDEGKARAEHEALLAELEGIRDVYQLDVRQFVAFIRERKLQVVEAFRQFARWLDEEHEGRRYSPATINRKIAAARSRVRYAFKQSAFARSLGRKHRLEDILKSVKLKKIDVMDVSSKKVLDVEQARKLIAETKDVTIRLMVTFLLSTGVRVSEMLGVRLSDIGEAKGDLVQIHVKGKGARERTVFVKKSVLERIRKHFHGQTWLFEHKGRQYSRISVTNRIKLEALRILGREVTSQQLRHTWAAIQIERGKAIRAVASVLGHSAPTRTAGSVEPADAFLDLDEEKGKGPRKTTGGDGPA